MGFKISDKTTNARLTRHLGQHQRKHSEALSRLSSGEVFTPENPKPSERALAEKMEFRVRSLSAAKRNINDAVSLLQTAESSMSEINNIVTRMKEINIAAASTTVADRERRFLVVEYDALYNELDRISQTTEYNGIPLLNGGSESVPEELVFRVGDPSFGIDGDEDLNMIRFDGLSAIDTTTKALGLRSAAELLSESTEVGGISIEDVTDMLEALDSDEFSTIYDQAITNLSTQRAIFGAMQSRLSYSMDFIDVYQENIAAAKSRISDSDYAEEISNLTASKIAVAATTALMAQSNISTNMSYQLIQSVL